MPPELETLLKIIEEKLGWGDSKTWQSRDFENLNQLILDKTNVSLSASTLRRLWGRVPYRHLPSTTTLDTIAQYADYTNWRQFLKQHAENTGKTAMIATPVVERKAALPVRKKIAWITALVIALAIAGIVAFWKYRPAIITGNYSFSSRPVTRQIPNSVIFTYDATDSPTDSVYIQQSWDVRTKTWVDKKLHQQSSVYYEPGFYHAKLIVGDTIVKEHPLLIPTDGWLGLIGQTTIPLYLQQDDFLHRDSISLPVATIEKKNVPMEPMPPVIKFYNVGNFEPVPLSGFAFNAEVKNEYGLGSGVCRFVHILLITDDAPLMIPLSAMGCVSELSLRNADEVVSGKKTDLSAFGVDFSDWVPVACKSVSGKIQFIVNGKLAYEGKLPAKVIKIVGFAFLFQGTGAVKNINLHKGDSLVFHSF